MRRALIVFLPMLASASLGGCQSYNFNPVGRCVIQPESKQVTLQDITTADILFVVDDSNSMASKQQALANNFNQFITALNQASIDRVNHGLQPFDFHIAVTTSSVFWAQQAADKLGNPTTCVLNAGQTQCCVVSSCSPISACVPGDGCGTNGKCTLVRSGIATPPAYPPVSFDYQCCTSVTGCQPQSCFPGDACPAYTTNNYSAKLYGCNQGVLPDGAPYAAGDFVAASNNPKVLHFTKDLYTPTPNNTAINQLSQEFAQNIQVGTCGSPQEQHLEAGRVALTKALNGQYGTDFPHVGAKLIVVWVGDEDDCSSPGPNATNADPSKSIVLAHAGDTGADECVADKNLAAQNQGVSTQDQIPLRAFPVSDYDAFFSGLVTPVGQKPTATQPYAAFGAAFIAGTAPCVDASKQVVSYTPADQYLAPVCAAASTPQYSVPSSSCPALSNGIYAAGVRFSQLAKSFRDRGYSVVEDTVCDSVPPATFGNVLSQIASLVSAPSALLLPGQPAASDITVVRIVDSSGNQTKVCVQAKTQADAATAGWWFMTCGAPTSPPPPVATDASGNPVVTSCVYINHDSGTCEANPGETYSAEYLGRVPAGGCASVDDCVTALGGKASDWTCYTASGTPSQQNLGTCLCLQGG